MRIITRVLASMGVCALLVTALGAPSLAANGTTRWVDDDGRAGPANRCDGGRKTFDSIQNAIDASGPSDTIIVCPGTYVEQLVIGGARHGLTVRGAVPWTARILAPRDIPDGENLVSVSGVRRVTLRHLLLLLPTGGECAHYENVIAADNANRVRIMGNRIRPTGSATAGDCGYHDGIDVDNSRNVRISNNLIVDFHGEGVVGDNTRGSIHGNSIRFFHANYGDEVEGQEGIRFGESRLTISANVIRTRGAFGTGVPSLTNGIQMNDGRPDSIIRGNRISGASDGIDFEGRDSRILRDLVTGNEEGIALHVDSQGNVIRGNDARGNSDFDCRDSTAGSGTAGTANTWVNNLGNAQDPEGLCEGDLAPI